MLQAGHRHILTDFRQRLHREGGQQAAGTTSCEPLLNEGRSRPTSDSSELVLPTLVWSTDHSHGRRERRRRDRPADRTVNVTSRPTCPCRAPDPERDPTRSAMPRSSSALLARRPPRCAGTRCTKTMTELALLPEFTPRAARRDRDLSPVSRRPPSLLADDALFDRRPGSPARRRARRTCYWVRPEVVRRRIARSAQSWGSTWAHAEQLRGCGVRRPRRSRAGRGLRAWLPSPT